MAERTKPVQGETHVSARARFTHVMRKWAADEARAIEDLLGRPCETRTTVSDRYAEANALPKESAGDHASAYVARMTSHAERLAEKRWAFVEAQLAKHGIGLA